MLIKSRKGASILFSTLRLKIFHVRETITVKIAKCLMEYLQTRLKLITLLKTKQTLAVGDFLLNIISRILLIQSHH